MLILEDSSQKYVLEVIIRDTTSNDIVHIQPLNEYEQQPTINLQATRWGNSLLDILMQEEQITGGLELKRLFTDNPHNDAIRMLGSIAEVMVVDLCNSNNNINRTLGKIARYGIRTSNSLDDYLAVATGSLKTKNLYSQHYNPNDTQRDIIWINKEDNESQLLCVRGCAQFAKPAGLQIKVSNNYRNILNSIDQYHYPVLYLDLNNDWADLSREIKNRGLNIVLYHAEDLHDMMKEKLRGYFQILISLFNKDIDLKYIIDRAKSENDTNLLKGLKGAENGINKLILPIDY